MTAPTIDRPTPVLDLDEDLHVLGATANEVANSLRRLGIKGQRRIGRNCPIAKYLRLRGHDIIAATANFIHTSYDGTPPPTPTPRAVAYFILEFDNSNLYPELEI